MAVPYLANRSSGDADPVLIRYAQCDDGVSALHFYERRGLQPLVPRDSCRRRYDERHLRRLAFTGVCQRAGLSLEEVALLLAAEPDRWRPTADARIRQIDADIARLALARETLAGSLRCPADHPADECPHVQSMIDTHLSEAGSGGSRP
jgi:DNA-binding transcriptional MerR regulator